MRIKKDESHETESVRNSVKWLIQSIQSKKAIFVGAAVICLISCIVGMGIAGFFGTIENPSPVIEDTAKEILTVFGIHPTNTKIAMSGMIHENVKLPLNYFNGLVSNPKMISIDIKNNDFQKLAYKRDIALSSGTLVTEDDDWVPAKIQYNDKTVDAKVRLKGDSIIDHLGSDKWSLRVEIKGDDTLLGMKVFSLQAPVTRGYVNEWLFHEVLRRENLIAIRDDFIDVTINGKDMGIYEIEEFFDKRLIENNHYREGPILRYNTNLYWSAHINGGGHDLNWYSGEVDAFQTNKIIDDPILYKQFITANDLLESFRNEDLKTSEVFDVDKLATFMALSDLMGAVHGTYVDNIRFYYNPITSRLEPIGYDGGTGSRITEISGTDISQNNIFKRTIFKDPVFYENYIGELERVSHNSYLDTLFEEINDELEENINIIHRDEPYYYFSDNVFYDNQEYIRDRLSPIKGLNAYFLKNENNSIFLEIGNIQQIPIEMIDLSIDDSMVFQPRDNGIVINGKNLSDPVHYENIEFLIPDGFTFSNDSISDIRVNYRLIGHSLQRNESIFPWPQISENFLNNDFIRKESNVAEFCFLSVDNSAQKIAIKPGNWMIDKDMIIPDGYIVFCCNDAPTELNLIDEAMILSYSPLIFRGNDDCPVSITSSDCTGEGIAVINAPEYSSLKWVSVSNLSAPSKDGLELSGAITFYNSNLDVENCLFSNNKYGDDMLDLVRSEYTIKNTLFRNIFSDALDDDFGKGVVSQTSFINCGNDALDFSGSYTDVNNCYIEETGDKAVSGGEGSRISLSDIVIENCNVGIASKDQSVITIDNMQMSSGVIGFTAYQKKSEFGPSEIYASGVEMTDVTIPSLIEIDSKLTLNGNVISGTEKDVYDRYYDGEATIETL